MKYEVRNLAVCVRPASGFLSVYGTACGIPGAFRIIDHAHEMGFDRTVVIDMDKYGVTEKELRTLFRCMEDVGVASLIPLGFEDDDDDDDECVEVVVRRYVR